MNSYEQAVHVKATWGRRCDKLLFFSSKEDKVVKRRLINAQPDHLCIDHLLPVLISASVKRDGVLQQMYCKCTDCPGLTSKLLFKELGSVALNLKEGRENLWAKTRQAFRYIYHRYKVHIAVFNV